MQALGCLGSHDAAAASTRAVCEHGRQPCESGSHSHTDASRLTGRLSEHGALLRLAAAHSPGLAAAPQEIEMLLTNSNATFTSMNARCF